MATNITFKEEVKLALETNDAVRAKAALVKLEKIIAGISEEGKLKPLERIRAQLMAVAMSFYSQKQIEDLFEDSSASIFYSPTIDLKAAVGDFLYNIHYTAEKDEAKQGMRKAIQRCTQKFTSEKIKLGSAEADPTVSNWYKSFISTVGGGRVSNVAMARYFANDEGFSKLKDEQKVAVRKMIEFVGYLNLSAASLEGFDEVETIQDEHGVLWRMGAGIFDRLFTEEDLQGFKAEYDAGDMSRDDFEEYHKYYPEDRFNKYFAALKGETLSTDQVLSNAESFIILQKGRFPDTSYASKVIPIDPMKKQALVLGIANDHEVGRAAIAIEVLKNVAQNKEVFLDFLESDPVQEFIKTKGQEVVSEKNKKQLQETPVSPIAFQALLGAILEKGLELKLEEAIWRAYQVCQKFPYELMDYKTLVTYDISQQRLVWRY